MKKLTSTTSPPFKRNSYVTTVIVPYILKWQYWAGNGAGAKIRKKSGAGAFGSAKLVCSLFVPGWVSGRNL